MIYGTFFRIARSGEACITAKKYLTERGAIKTDWEIGLHCAVQLRLLKLQCWKPHTVLFPMSEKEILSIYRNAASSSQDLDVIGAYTVSGIGAEYSIVQIPRNISVKENDILRLDGGANICGYQADIARTLW